jgi:glycosyltransferase involved in cell wall biosynthesis
MILISIFQNVNGLIPSSGVGKFGLRLFRDLSLYRDTLLYYGNRGKIVERGVEDLGCIYFFLYRIIGVFGRFLSIKEYKLRMIREFIYDLFLSFQLNDKIDILITTNAWMPLSAMTAKKKGTRIILLAGNANDNYISQLVRAEKVKLGIHGFDSFDYPSRLKKYNDFLSHVDKIVCINEYIVETYKSDISINAEIVLMPMIFDADFVLFDIKKFHDNAFVIMFCAHTTVLKGLHILVDVFNSFKKGKQNVELYIVGNIDPIVFNLLQSKLKCSSIKLFGQLSGAHLSEYFKIASVFVVPSLTDAAPVTMIEAMWSRTPVVVSSGVGNRWLIENGINGYVYSMFDKDMLEDCLNLFYYDRELLNSLGEKGRNTIEDLLEKNIGFDSYFN